MNLARPLGLALATATMIAASPVAAQQAPYKLGIVTFLSGERPPAPSGSLRAMPASW